MDFDEDTATTAVTDSFTNTPDARLKHILGIVTRHLHDAVRELALTQEEWARAIDFLTAVGQKCDDTRQEFVLLSDILGVSMLVETINEGAECTESTVLGPFHMTESPARELGDSIDLVGTGTPCVITGTVNDADGAALPGAVVDVWQCDENGLYDVQQPDVQPAGNGRGLFRADDEGRFWFRTVVPSHYPIPTDGPVGALLTATRRHPYRPAHVHVLASAPGHEELVTHMFVADSPYLDSDAVFAVKASLVTDFAPSTDAALAARHGVEVPFRHAHFDVRLCPKNPTS
ncbi:dioxygenase family protein [Streptomyces cavernicola]|uniref:Dioxygenase n=1 Tax=Streptomyces cavernicola TaxID=3043613 RepID=A0ABT6S563_9ACTN|nr:dioxygenase [Streptomyces sp. B-S-A6]MDI3403213.1 dioxygenase [Streptomyces sp. B-S-A6]